MKESLWLLRDKGEGGPHWGIYCLGLEGNSGDFEQNSGGREVAVFWIRFEGRATDFAVGLDKDEKKRKSSRMLLQVNNLDRLPRLEPRRAG